MAGRVRMMIAADTEHWTLDTGTMALPSSGCGQTTHHTAHCSHQLQTELGSSLNYANICGPLMSFRIFYLFIMLLH